MERCCVAPSALSSRGGGETRGERGVQGEGGTEGNRRLGEEAWVRVGEKELEEGVRARGEERDGGEPKGEGEGTAETRW